MKNTQLVYFGIIVLIVCGCVTARVEFNHNPDTKIKIKSAFIHVKGIRIKGFIKKLGDSFLDALTRQNVTAQLTGTDVLSLDSPKDIENQIQNYHPDVVITIERMGDELSRGAEGNTFVNGGTYLIAIKLLNSDKPFWKASIRTEGEINGEASEAVQRSMDKIIQRMIDDELL